MNDTMRAAADFLLSHDNYDILTHDYPDGDTLGSGSLRKDSKSRALTLRPSSA